MHYIYNFWICMVCKSNFYTRKTSKFVFTFFLRIQLKFIFVHFIITRQWNNPWLLNASVTGCLDRAVYVPVGEGLVLQGRQQQEVVCFEDMRLQQKYDQGQEADYHPCIITIIYYIPQKVQTIVSPTRRGEVLELLAGKSFFHFYLFT